jgi:hypothetical protein
MKKFPAGKFSITILVFCLFTLQSYALGNSLEEENRALREEIQNIRAALSSFEKICLSSQSLMPGDCSYIWGEDIMGWRCPDCFGTTDVLKEYPPRGR